MDIDSHNPSEQTNVLIYAVDEHGMRADSFTNKFLYSKLL
jgi:hypothetical protein